MSALEMLTKQAKDRTSKEIEKLLAKGDRASSEKAARLMTALATTSYEDWKGKNIDPLLAELKSNKIDDKEFHNRLKSIYYGKESFGGGNGKPVTRALLFSGIKHTRRSNLQGGDVLGNSKHSNVETAKIKALNNAINTLSDEELERTKIGGESLSKWKSGDKEAKERILKGMKVGVHYKPVYIGKHNPMEGKNGKRYGGFVYRYVAPKSQWGKIAAGVGALGALGYGAYKYKQNKDNKKQ